MNSYTPTDYANPAFEMATRVHDWKNYVSKELIDMWGTFNDAQKRALARAFEEVAMQEEWD